MSAFICVIAIIAGACAIGYLVAEALESGFTGILAGLAVAIWAFGGLGDIIDSNESDARVEMAAAQCVKAVTDSSDVSTMTMTDMRAAAREGVNIVGLETGTEAEEAVATCYQRIVSAASAASADAAASTGNE